MLEGYKGFSKGLINAYGMKFELYKDYKVDISEKILEYGVDGYGFHFAKRLEDCLRYYNGLDEEIEIAQVIALGNVLESYDDYYGYYDLYVTDHIYIEHVLTREEIINYIKNANPLRIERFIMEYKLTSEEIEFILKENPDNERIMDAIDYYQYGNKYVYEKKWFGGSYGWYK